MQFDEDSASEVRATLRVAQEIAVAEDLERRHRHRGASDGDGEDASAGRAGSGSRADCGIGLAQGGRLAKQRACMVRLRESQSACSRAERLEKRYSARKRKRSEGRGDGERPIVFDGEELETGTHTFVLVNASLVN